MKHSVYSKERKTYNSSILFTNLERYSHELERPVKLDAHRCHSKKIEKRFKM